MKQQPPEFLYADAREYMQRGEFAKANLLADDAYRRFHYRSPDWSARFVVLKGEILLREGRSKQALRVLDQPLPSSLRNDDVAVRQLIARGVAHSRLQEFAEAENCLNEAERMTTGRSPQVQAEVAINRGTFFASRDDYDKARAEYRQALQWADKTNNDYVRSNSLGGLGFASMQQGRYDEAIDWFDASLAVAYRIGNQALQAMTLGNLGWSYYRLGDLERAKELLQQGASVFAKHGMLLQEGSLLNDLGLVTFDQGQYETSANYLKQALSISQAIHDQEGMVNALGNLANVALEDGELEVAASYASESLSLSRRTENRMREREAMLSEALVDGARENYRKSENELVYLVRTAREPWLRWTAQSELARTYAIQQRYIDADREFKNGLATIDEARAALNVEEHRLSFLTSASRFYNSYIDFLVEQGRANDALRIAEHSRARTLAEGLGLKSASLHSTLPPEQISRQSGAVILEYWLKPNQSYLWAVTSSKVAIFKLPADTEINAAVQDYRKALLGPRDPLETGNASGRKLYDMLIAPAQQLIRPGARVIVIADGSLNNLNFETLIAPAPKPHYWIDDVVLSDASSMGLLAGSRHAAAPRQKNLLLVGDPTSASPEYPRLPQAATEIDRVEQHFPSKARLVLAGAQATPQAYLASDTGRFSYVHFVAHGTASRTTPLESAVILSPAGDSYKLYARDIVTKALHADLVTISTCYGAGSRAYTGEGLVGLSWAFLRAGAHNTIAALWEVNDASTAQLMDQLYAGIDKGRDPAVALRAAKLAMLHSDGVYRRPFYWAPFQLYQGSSGTEPQVSAPHSVR
jgi:CHAT domain-containing protein/Tfp pilus assembly protein PilF